MGTACQWDCGCWDCLTDRRNSIRLALAVALAIALAGGCFVAFEASGALDNDDDAPRGEVVAVA